MGRKQKQPAYVKPKQLSLFYAEFIIDPNLRDDRDLMSYPFLSLSKRKRTEPIRYRDDKNGIKIEVTGSNEYGIASIFDYDIILWLGSILNEGIEQGHNVSPIIRFNPYKFLVQAGWITEGNKGGRGYLRLKKALQRLQSTSISTTIKSAKKEVDGQWSWIDQFNWYKDKNNNPIDYVEIQISDWLYNRITKDRSILSIHPKYFSLKKGMSKWIYRIARRHCGNQDVVQFAVETLFRRYPTIRHFRQFKHQLHKLVDENAIPEYNLTWHVRNGRDVIIITPKPGSRSDRRLPRSVRGVLPR